MANHLNHRPTIEIELERREGRRIRDEAESTPVSGGGSLTAQNQDLYQDMINALQEGLIYADPDGVVVEMNDCAQKILGWRKERVLGKSIFDFHNPKAQKRIKAMLHRFRSDPDEGPQIIQRKVDERWVEMRILPLRDSRSNLQGIILNLIDQSDKKQLEEKQRSLELKLIQEHKLSAMGVLASGIAHNLNGPLAVIVGYLDLLYTQHPDLEEIPLILAQTERLKEIISNMMVKSRHEQDLRSRPLNLNTLLQNELKFLEANLDFKHKIDKQYEFAVGMPDIYGVYSDFSQCFLNIIDNAIDAMVDSPVRKLNIKTSFDDENIYVEFRDTGHGLDPHNVHKIFTPFYSTKPPVGEGHPDRPTGTGLGLSSSYQLIKDYGGTIEVEGKPGQGATFKVVIPIYRNLPPESSESIPVEVETGVAIKA